MLKIFNNNTKMYTFLTARQYFSHPSELLKPLTGLHLKASFIVVITIPKQIKL